MPLIKSSALITRSVNYKAGCQMLVVSGPPTVKFLFSGVNGNSRLCVTFEQEFVNCLAHTSSVPISRYASVDTQVFVVSCPTHDFTGARLSPGSYLYITKQKTKGITA